MNRQEDCCPYCDTICIVEFEDEDDLLTFCPSCGEEYPEEDDEELDCFADEDVDGGFLDE